MIAYIDVIKRYFTNIRPGTEAPTSEHSDLPPRRPSYLRYIEI